MGIIKIVVATNFDMTRMIININEKICRGIVVNKDTILHAVVVLWCKRFRMPQLTPLINTKGTISRFKTIAAGDCVDKVTM